MPETPRHVVAVEVRLERAVGAGRVLGHDAAGRVVLAEGGLPGERVTVELRRERPRFAVGTVVSVEEASPDRVEPPCPAVSRGCGGCDLQHATPSLQRAMKVEVLRDALAHLAGVHDLPVDPGAVLADTGYRTTLRLGVHGGRAGFRHRRSHRVVPVDACLVAHPQLQRVLGGSRFPGAAAVTLRTSVATGASVAVVDRSAARAVVPEGVEVVDEEQLRRGAPVHLVEEVGGRRLRVSARSFFQAGPAAAAALCDAVRRALDGFSPDEQLLVDLFGGVGLFTAVLGARRAVVVERSASAVADARVNTAELGARVVHADVARWDASPADAVVVDPPRQGLGADAADVVAATGASRVALVSCDPAALGRDVALLVERGYRPARVELVEQFAHTHHVEAVTTLHRVGR